MVKKAEILKEEVVKPEDTNIVDISAEEVYAHRFREYGTSTVLARAIPNLIDGLLPVRRKILFTFLKSKADKPKKATYFIGNCMATVYVQGDASLYGAMVSMSQWFKMLNPLLTPTGSVGSPHNPTPAAARYLELSLSPFGKDVFFTSYDENVIPMKDNYDATLKEPLYFSPLFPTIFNIGITGIGSGFASEIPPHRVEDICGVTRAYLNNPAITTEELVKDLVPDFPLGGIITNRSELPAMYANGHGVIKVQATIEEGTYKGKDILVVKDLPYKISTETILEQISTQSKLDPKTKKEGVFYSVLQEVLDISDKHNPVQLILIPKRGVSLNVLKNLLLKHTSLTTSVKYLCNVLDGNSLMVNASFKDVIAKWCDARIQYYQKKSAMEISELARKVTINRALIKAQANIEEIVKAIRTLPTKKDVIEYLAKTLEISRSEADYISEMKLYRLSSVEAKSLEDEIVELNKKIAYHEGIFKDPNKAKTLIIKDLDTVVRKYSTKRKTVCEDSSIVLDQRAFVENEGIVGIISQDNVVYHRLEKDLKSYASRGCKGESLIPSRYKRTPKLIFHAKTHDMLLIATNRGNIYKAMAIDFMVNNKALHNTINFTLKDKESEHIIDIIPLDENYFNDKDKYLIVGSRQSWMKRVPLSAISNINTRGLILTTLPDGDELVNVKLVSSLNDNIAVGTSQGRVQVFKVEDLQEYASRTARGLQRVRLKDNEVIASIDAGSGEELLFVSEKGDGKYIPISIIPERSKAKGKGSPFVGIKLLKENDKLYSLHLFNKDFIEDHQLLLVSNANKNVSIPLKEVTGRDTRNSGGIRLINLDTEEVTLFSTIL